MRKENVGIIYKITSPSNKIYIGQTIDYNKRLIKYRCGDSKGQIKLHRSFNKYGIENHIFEIIEECNIELLNERERYWQDYYDVLKGLNCLLTNTNTLSGKRSEETCNKIKENNAKYWLRKNHSNETRLKISESKKGHKDNLGKKHSIETKQKMSKSKQKLVINIITKEISTISEISKLTNINKNTLRSNLNGNSKNFTNFKYLENYE